MKTIVLSLLSLFILAFLPSCTTSKKHSVATKIATMRTIAPVTAAKAKSVSGKVVKTPASKPIPVVVRRAIPIPEEGELVVAQPQAEPATVQQEKIPVVVVLPEQVNSKTSIASKVTESRPNLPTTKPEQVKRLGALPKLGLPAVTLNKFTLEEIINLPPIPESVVHKLMEMENYPLFAGNVKVAKKKKGEIGFGVVHDELKDAWMLGIPTNITQLPDSMSREDAMNWTRNKTLVIYRKMVREIITVPLDENKEAVLVLFAQNMGLLNLRKLVTQDNRLNSGNYASVAQMLPIYYKDPGGLPGLAKRGKYLKELWETIPIEYTHLTVQR